MAHSGVGPGKKRITITVTESVVTRFQTICKETNLPPATLSRSIDDFLKGIVDVLETARSRGRFTIRDMFTMMGEQMELIQEGKNDVKQTSKTKGVENDPFKKGRYPIGNTQRK
jgi:hypothetical protein